MPHKIYQCDFCDFTHKKKKKVKKHEHKDCRYYRTCGTCKYMTFWWGSFSCESPDSIHHNIIIPNESVEYHWCDDWKRKKK